MKEVAVRDVKSERRASQTVDDLSEKLDALMKMMEIGDSSTVLLGKHRRFSVEQKRTLVQQKWSAARVVGKERLEKRAQARSRWQFAHTQYKLHRAELREKELKQIERHRLEAEANNLLHVATGRRSRLRRTQVYAGLGKNWFILVPGSPISTIWTLLAASAVLFVAGELPVRLAFLKTDDSCGYYVLDRVLDAFFMLDVVINFVSGYQNADGQLVVEPRQVAIRYLRSWFILDLVATIPLDVRRAHQQPSNEHRDPSVAFERALRPVQNPCVPLPSPTRSLYSSVRPAIPTLPHDTLCDSSLIDPRRGSSSWIPRRAAQTGSRQEGRRACTFEPDPRAQAGQAATHRTRPSRIPEHAGHLKRSSLHGTDQRVFVFIIMGRVGCIQFLIARIGMFDSRSWVVRAGMAGGLRRRHRA